MARHTGKREGCAERLCHWQQLGEIDRKDAATLSLRSLHEAQEKR